MRITTTSCDRCKAEEPKELYRTQVIASSGPYIYNTGTWHSKEIDVCRPCMTVLFDFAPKQGEPARPDPQHTALEIVEMLAEALREDTNSP